MFSDEIVSCYKDTAELVLFHDVETEWLAPANIVVNSANRLNIPVSSFLFVEVCGVFHRLRTVTARGPHPAVAFYVFKRCSLHFPSVQAPCFMSAQRNLLIL